MVQEAEKCRHEDEAHKAKIEAMNGSESCRSTVRNNLKEEKLKDKFQNESEEKMEKRRARYIDFG